MKEYIIEITLLIFLSFTGTIVNAQDDNFSTSVTAGIASRLLDQGTGFHIGLNSVFSLSPYFAVEGQTSYVNTKITGSFISGEEGVANSINVLAGVRMFLGSDENRVRPSVNLLTGVVYNKERMNNEEKSPEFGLGYSAGAYFDINRFLVGVSYDTPGNIILKVGYILKSKVQTIP